MSLTRNHYEASRWLATAREDLTAAQALSRAELYAHACFQSQQCSEKAIKAMWIALGEDPWGHSIQKLIMQFPAPEQIPDWQNWLSKAATLDKFYIPTRYPNGLPDLTPGQSYFPADADQAIKQATFFVSIAQEFLDGLRDKNPL